MLKRKKNKWLGAGLQLAPHSPPPRLKINIYLYKMVKKESNNRHPQRFFITQHIKSIPRFGFRMHLKINTCHEAVFQLYGFE